MERSRPIKLFFDGGCRPNPGRMESAVVARGVTHLQTDLGYGTSHQAEWKALLHALEVAKSIGAAEIVLLGDSLDVINIINGACRCSTVAQRNAVAEFVELSGAFSSVRLRHVRRTQNLAGIALDRMRNAV